MHNTKSRCGKPSPEEVELFSDDSEARCLADVQAGFAHKVAGVQHVLHLLTHIRQLVTGRLHVVLILKQSTHKQN